jgi:hypothetical protein
MMTMSCPSRGTNLDVDTVVEENQIASDVIVIRPNDQSFAHQGVGMAMADQKSSSVVPGKNLGQVAADIIVITTND